MADIEDIQYKLLRELSERYQCTIDDLLNEAVYEYYEDERREMIRQEAMKHKDESQTVLEAVLGRQTDEDRRKMEESIRKAIKDEQSGKE